MIDRSLILPSFFPPLLLACPNRTMREVDSILSTQDGSHVLVLCTDGCVMYYENKAPLIAAAAASIASCPPLPASPPLPAAAAAATDASSETSNSSPIPAFPAEPVAGELPDPSRSVPGEQEGEEEEEQGVSLEPDAQDEEEGEEEEEDDEGGDDLQLKCRLQELSELQRDLESDQAWALRRVGAAGEVVLVRAYQAKAAGRIRVNLLSSEYCTLTFAKH